MRFLSLGFFMFFLLFQSCLPIEDNSVIISFYTDSDIDSDIEHALYINDEPVGLIRSRLDDAVCNTTGLISVENTDSQDMIIQIKSSNGSIVDIGLINISAPSTGIIIKPNAQNAIFVFHDIDDPCTIVRLRW